MARILVIDDDAPARTALRVVLEVAGHQVAEASDGASGIRLYTESPVDLVITDLMMPDKDGLETIRELREATPDLKIILISGSVGADEMGCLQLAREYGTARTFTKPFDRAEMVTAVKELLANDS